MITVTFLGTLAALAIILSRALFSEDKSGWLVGAGIYIGTYLISLLLVFTFLPSKSLFGLLWLNVCTGVLALILSFAIPPKNDNYVIGIPMAVWGLVFVVAVIGVGTTFFSVKSVYNSLKVETKKEAPLLSDKETPIAISPKTVRNKMNKAMSTVPNTSYYRLGDLQTQVVNGKAVYIAPVELDGLWKWQKVGYTPGYFEIDATNVNAEPVFVKTKMKYTPSAYFNDDAQRVIYNRFSDWVQKGDPQLEVSDSGDPYYVQTVYKARGISKRVNYSSLHVVVLDAKTGTTRLYKTSKAPAFVNESITSSVASDMNDVFGQYQHGFWNALFSKQDVKSANSNGTEDGVTPVVDKHGNISYFTDFTSPKSDVDSTMGYSMINARTGVVTYYTGKNIGVMDSTGAKKIADKEYVAQKWRANMPILYNIDGTPTWIVSLLDSTGAFRSYAYIKATDQSVKAYASTAQEALNQYRVQLENAGGTASSTGNTHTLAITGKVTRMAIVSNGTSETVQFVLSNSKVLFTVDTNDYPRSVLLKTGDTVKLKAKINKASNTGNVQQFSNTSFK